MPIHYVERALLDAKVAELEANGEVIASVVAEGDNFQVFTQKAKTRKATGEVETR